MGPYIPYSLFQTTGSCMQSLVPIGSETWICIRCKQTYKQTFIFIYKIKKVKVTLVQALMLCTGSTAHRGSRGIALLFHDHSMRRGGGISVTPRPLFTPGKDLVHIVQEAGWAPGPVWKIEDCLK